MGAIVNRLVNKGIAPMGRSYKVNRGRDRSHHGALQATSSGCVAMLRLDHHSWGRQRR
jgi:hypothetical protein